MNDLPRMDIAEFKRNNPLEALFEAKGVKLIGNGKERQAKCPFHEDKNPSLSVNVEKQIYFCQGCGAKGDAIDLAAHFEGVHRNEFLKRNSKPPAEIRSQPVVDPKGKIEKIYPYHDANGREVFQVVRMIPKTFRQRHIVGENWVWSMEGVSRVLYHLPDVLSAGRVWICEGEKDADNLIALGFTATCNVGGAGKWLDSYTESLKGKEVVLCGDNDDPGKKHMELVLNSISGKVTSTREVRVPHGKDVSDFIATFSNKEDARAALAALMESAKVFVRGFHVPIKAIWEIERPYCDYIQNLNQYQFNLGNWIPKLGRNVRGLVPGELVTILAATGVGKTALLQNIARHSAPLKTILFELELPEELVYERFISIAKGWTGDETEKAFRQAIENKESLGEQGHKKLNHVFVCTETRVSCEQLELWINRAELVIGQRPNLVLLDYIQLVQGKGSSRYERMSNIAEELKIIAKSCRVILIIASQIHRREGEDPEVSLFDAKDSGSIENSSGLVLGVWRDAKDKKKMKIKVLKNTKGQSGVEIDCEFSGDSMQIKEMSPVAQEGNLYGRNGFDY